MVNVTRFTPREVALFRRLLFLKDFRSGFKSDIVRQLEGSGANTSTHAFVEKLIDLSCLTFVGTTTVKVMNHMEERPLYDRDRKRMKEVWRSTVEFKLSYEIMDEDEGVWT